MTSAHAQKFRDWHWRWTPQVWTVAGAKAAVIASGKRLRPTMTRKHSMRGHHGDQALLNPAVLQFGHRRKPDLRAFVVSNS